MSSGQKSSCRPSELELFVDFIFSFGFWVFCFVFFFKPVDIISIGRMMPPPFQGKSSQTKLFVLGICGKKNRGGIQLQPSSLLMPSSVHRMPFCLGIPNPEIHSSPFPLSQIFVTTTSN